MNNLDTYSFEFKKNCFTFLRYLGAFQVVYGHLIAHFNILNYFPFLQYFSGVPIFFCLSGFLISHSLSNSALERRSYFKNRFLRLYPELWIAILVNSVIIIIILDTSFIKDLYFWLFNITQGTFFQFWTPESLRIYGVGTPNGSLWTIAVFVQFYVIIYFLYPIMKKLSIKHHLFFLLISFLPNILFVYMEAIIPIIAYKLLLQTIIPYWFLFYTGILIYLYKDKLIPLLKKYFYPILVVFLFYSIFLNNIPAIYMDPIRIFLLCLLTIGFGYKFSFIQIKKDYSFGLYIWHMVIVNVFVQLNFNINLFGSLLVLILSLILAFMSGKLVSRFVIRKGRK